MGYSKKNEYDAEVKDLVKEVLLKCSKHHIPVFMTFAVEDDGTRTTYFTEMLSAMSEGVDLSDDKLVKHAMVTGGFEVVPKKEIPVLEEIMEVM